jgi:hypothetical protein
MSANIVLQWNFSPTDYFEEMVETVYQGHMIKITDGKIETKINADIFAENPSLNEKLHQCLNNLFLIQQLLIYKRHKRYTLSKPVKTLVYQDGRKEYFLEAEPAIARAVVSSVELQITDKDGRIIADPKAERLEKTKRSREKFIRHISDRLLLVLLQSYDAAVKDSNDELVHLYEIRDALCKRFGSDNEARTALDITYETWRRFGQLCNKEPLNQGRHRGQNASEALRDARPDELVEARRIAWSMINAYVQYLDTC